MKSTKTSIIINTSFAAIHQWATIPNNHPMQFLRFPHRHLFHVQLKLPVHHDDRDVEFIDLKWQVDQFIASRYIGEDGRLKNLGAMSCEMIARELMEVFGACYVRVLEDAENGAEIIKVDQG